MGEQDTRVGPGRPPVAHQFKPGNPGRPKGARNKLGEQFIAALAAPLGSAVGVREDKVAFVR